MDRDFNNIRAWQLSDELCVRIYQATFKFPKEELYGVTSQLRRAGVSVPANIAEGAGRQHKKDYLHFLYIARGSMSETRYFLHLCKRLGYLSVADYESLEAQRKEAAATLQGLIRAVEKEAGVTTRLIAFLTSTVAISCFDRFFAGSFTV